MVKWIGITFVLAGLAMVLIGNMSRAHADEGDLTLSMIGHTPAIVIDHCGSGKKGGDKK